MTTEKPRWAVSQNDLGRLSKTLKPIRTAQEVAEILGVSASLVCQVENSALRKIVRALKSHNGFKGKPQSSADKHSYANENGGRA